MSSLFDFASVIFEVHVDDYFAVGFDLLVDSLDASHGSQQVPLSNGFYSSRLVAENRAIKVFFAGDDDYE